MHVDDLSEAVIFCLEKWNPNKSNAPKDQAGNPLYFLNVGTGEDISILRLSEIISMKLVIKARLFGIRVNLTGLQKSNLTSKN